jgi:trans-aconitate 2-methyltransferase
LLKDRWPGAAVTGVDGSLEMLAVARASRPDICWVQADIGNWQAQERPDLIFSNAALHWLDDHRDLFPRLMGMLSPGGVIAVQMPRNFHAPSHTCIPEIVAAGPWRNRLQPILRAIPVAEPRAYVELLLPLARTLDVWETEYQHVLTGEEPVVEWTAGTVLAPFLDALDEVSRLEFRRAYARCVGDAYPKTKDGRTPFPFRRLFIVATL